MSSKAEISLLIRSNLNSFSCAKPGDWESFGEDYMNVLISEQVQRIRNLIFQCKHASLQVWHPFRIGSKKTCHNYTFRGSEWLWSIFLGQHKIKYHCPSFRRLTLLEVCRKKSYFLKIILQEIKHYIVLSSCLGNQVVMFSQQQPAEPDVQAEVSQEQLSVTIRDFQCWSDE